MAFRRIGDNAFGTPFSDTYQAGGPDTARSIFAGAGNDTITIPISFVLETVSGGLGNDFIDLVRTQSDVFVFDIGGNDTVEGGHGKDQILDWFGNDSLDGGLNDDHITDLFGEDFIYGGRGRDTIDAGFGNDFVNGGVDDAFGYDFSYGGENDSLILNSFEVGDVLTGGLGRDIFQVVEFGRLNGAGQDLVTDFEVGQDRLRFVDTNVLDFQQGLVSEGVLGPGLLITAAGYAMFLQGVTQILDEDDISFESSSSVADAQ